MGDCSDDGDGHVVRWTSDSDHSEGVSHVIGASLYLMTVLVSTTLNLMLVDVFMKRRFSTRNSFYLIVWQIVVCDLMENCAQITIAIPITLTGRQLYAPNSFAFLLFTVMETLAYNGTLYFNALLALNRLAVFCFPNCNRALFQSGSLKITTSVTWLFVALIVGLLNVCGCVKLFSVTGIFYDDCEQAARLGWWKFIFTQLFNVYIGTILPFGILFVYCLIFAFIRITMRSAMPAITSSSPVVVVVVGQHPVSSSTGGVESTKTFPSSTASPPKRVRANRREYGILVQSAVICGVLVLENITFQALPYLTNFFTDIGATSADDRPANKLMSNSSSISRLSNSTTTVTDCSSSGMRLLAFHALNFFGNLLLLLNCSVTPIILFVFNAEVRRAISERCKRRRLLTGTITASSMAALRRRVATVQQSAASSSTGTRKMTIIASGDG